MESDGIAAVAEPIEQYPGRPQGGVAAQVHLHRGCEPAQIEFSVFARYEECRLRQVVLPGNGPHRRFRQPLPQWHDRGGISPEQPVGERIDLV